MKIITLCLLSFTILFSSVFAEDAHLRLATTTSVENSGLLKVILPPFEERFGCKIDVIAVGTGKALKLAENGDVDVVLVHDREAERRFLEAGFGINRREIMYNDFVILGPADAPDEIRASMSAVQAFQRISKMKGIFISRGDQSGTHLREKSIWKEAEIEPDGSWYRETGQGMGQTLIIADQMRAYTLADSATYLAMKQKLKLTIVYRGDPKLVNIYSIIAVNPARHPDTRYVLAMALIGWLTSPSGQGMIESFQKDGDVLFKPSALHR